MPNKKESVSMDEKSLTAKEISCIIDKCGKNGVKSFKFRGLELDFAPKNGIFAENLQESPPKIEQLENLVEKASPKETFTNLLEEAKFLDPVLYEKLSSIDEPTN